MTAVTLWISISASIFILYLKPAKALGVYLSAMLLYPSYLVVRLGVLDISLGRILVTVLLLRCIFSGNISKNFKWIKLDTFIFMFITVVFFVAIVATKGSVMRSLENKSGFMMDTCFAYLVARFCITTQSEMMTTVKVIFIPLLLLSILGIAESVFAWQPYKSLLKYRPWEVLSSDNTDPRFGFHRATGPYGTPINFGNALCIFLPFLYLLRYESGWSKNKMYSILSLTVIGICSSMSSAAWVLMFFLLFAFALEKRKHLVKPILMFFLLMCVLVSIVSNRPFYHVIVSYANPLGGTAWHRAKLIDLAIADFDKWYLAGFGGVDPGWGPSLGRRWTDITNQYVAVGVDNGLIGLLVFICIFVICIGMLRKIILESRVHSMRTTSWALGSLIVGLAILLNSCTLFDQTKSFFYVVLGVIGSLFSAHLNFKKPIALK